MVLRRTTPALACAAVLAGAVATGACGTKEKVHGAEEPAREGIAVSLEGIHYTVFLTRELNIRITPDKAYYNGPAPPRGQSLYGVFLQVCNNTEHPRPTARHFKVVDNQGNEFEPKELPEDNAFAYTPRRLQPGECLPEAGSVAELGPTSGSMLLFQFPLTATENRPLELEIEGGPEGETAEAERRTVELDL